MITSTPASSISVAQRKQAMLNSINAPCTDENERARMQKRFRLQHFRFCSLQKAHSRVAFSSRKSHLLRVAMTTRESKML
jgi:hypothetical protein